jgi:LacI family transcriptional regulator/LacI family repressor for deo operon, udp, cdd, tsx, nupC, and nupG
MSRPQLFQKLAKEMGYIPSAVAQNLAHRKTWTVGMIVTDISDPNMGQLVEGVEVIAQAADYNVFLSASRNDPDREEAVVEAFQRRRVDGIIIIASHLTSLYSSRLEQMQVPIVHINDEAEGKYLYSLTIDDVQGARLAVEHLLELGHRRIGYVHDMNRKSGRNRLEGYQTALKAAGITLDPALVIALNIGDNFMRGEASLESLIANGATAVFCYNDMVAIGLLTACRKRGVSVPDDLSIVGFDDIEAAAYTVPPLTTFHQPRLKFGKLAMTMMLGLLNEQETQDQILTGELVLRESTGKCLHC